VSFGTGSKFSLDRFYGRLTSMATAYEFFSHNEFKWETRNFEALQRQIPAGEVATFNTSVKGMHVQSYLDSVVLGIKKFMMKQDMSLKQKEIAKSKKHPPCTCWGPLPVSLQPEHNIISVLCNLPRYTSSQRPSPICSS